MYARIACTTGWTWEYIGQCLTLPRVYAMVQYWKASPPVNEAVAAYLGIGDKATVEQPITDAKRVQSVIADVRRMQVAWPTTKQR